MSGKKRYDIKYSRFYGLFYNNLSPNLAGECSVKAFCHSDKHESMSINLITGKYMCHTCSKGGFVYDFYKDYRELIDNENVDINYAKSICDDIMEGIEVDETIIKLELDIPDMDIVEAKHEALLDERGTDFYKFLTTERGLTPKTIIKYKLMWWSAERIGIPIFEGEHCIGVRCYSSSNKNKMIWDKTGRTCKLFPLENLKKDQPILLCEGEMDCILANQMGYNAMTVTGGAGTWKESFSPLFKDRIVWICYDIDKTGESGSFKVASSIVDYAKEVKIIHLPIKDDKNKDITDFFIKLGYNKSDLDEIIDNTAIFKAKTSKKVENNNDVKLISLNDINLNHGKTYEIKCLIAGKTSSSYLVPTKYAIRCIPSSTKQDCQTCPGSVNVSSVMEIEFDHTDRTILQLFECNDNEKMRVLKENANVPFNCMKCMIEEQKTISVKQVMLVPDIDFSTENQEYVLKEAFVIDNDVETGQSYLMRGTTWSHPKDQRAVSQIDYVERTRDNISSFKMTPELFDKLKIFQSVKGKVQEKMDEITKDMSLNVTKIYGRQDLHIAVDLIFHSVLSFKFNGKVESRGWAECLLLGDTRCGKSEVVQRLIEHYKAGEFLTGESTSFAGLVGGVNTSGKKNMVTWGKIPMNDRRLVAIDEVSGMSIDILEKMSGVRSSGVAEITKIQIERTHARTRLIWISNDREGKGLAGSGTYGGVDALIDLIGKMEDIARFEFVVTAANGEVPLEEINQRLELIPKVAHKYTTELCNSLVMWVWSRKVEDIVFTTEAIDSIYAAANKMGEMYSPSVLPLVEGANQRIKISRLAVAVACRVFSTSNGNDVQVLPEHVDYVVDYLNQIYSKESFGYAQLSENEIAKKSNIDVVYKNMINMFKAKKNLGENLATLKSFAMNELEYVLNVDKEEAKKMISYFVKNGLVVKNGNSYRKTESMNKILRRWKIECDGGR